LARMVSEADLIPITTQRYYAIDFIRPHETGVKAESTMLTS